MLEQRIIEIENSDLSEELMASTIEALFKFKPVNNDLVCNGYPDYYAYKAEEYYKRLGDIDEKYLEILFKWFPSNITGRHLVGILEKCSFEYDNKIFINIFTQIDRDTQWYLCDVIDRNRRWKGIEEWIQNIYLDESQMEQVDLLALSVCRMYKPEMALPILKQGFDLRPPMTAFAIGKIGGIKEFEFLEQRREYYLKEDSQRGYPKSLILKEIKMAMKKNAKRINK